MERFRLGGVPGVTPAKWLRVWRERVPDVPAQLVSIDEADAVLALQDGRVDAVLARLPVAGEGLHIVRLYDELPVVVAAKGHPIVAFETVTTADLDGEPMLEQGELTLAQLLETVAAGAGVAIVPMSVARALSGPDTRQRVVTDLPPTTIALVWLEAADSPLHQELIGIARGRKPGSSRGDREHLVEPGNAATGAKPRSSKPKPKPGANRPRRPGGPGRSGRPGPGRRR
ncbi:LysR family transcriptional regulator substrate-binding protein [Agrococcus sp. ARC_14]|uniref:LysR family transcriptional regulator substrate-binding protein n=1 Tax=Agrococcus sp. ARC_14 TaxID=2919927 RepID=UPI001F066940|nr:LysR family transcriptional regulator substrate-binding protein [Agrococcus sp. ARC_14]MCH1884108.1 LysR family transcriptional regulator substrate-binding protein [Agrococcus sp. ARC_14]